MPGWTDFIDTAVPLKGFLTTFETEDLSVIQNDPKFCYNLIDGNEHDGGWMRKEMIPSHSPFKIIQDNINLYGVTAVKCFYKGATPDASDTEIKPRHSDGKYQGYYPRYTCDLYEENPMSCKAEADCKPCFDMKVQFFCTCANQAYTEITLEGEVVTVVKVLALRSQGDVLPAYHRLPMADDRTL